MVHGKEIPMLLAHPRVASPAMVLAILASCATVNYTQYQERVPVPLASKEKDAAAKAFTTTEGRGKIYVYLPRVEGDRRTFSVYQDSAMNQVGVLRPGGFFVMEARDQSIKFMASDERALPAGPPGGRGAFILSPEFAKRLEGNPLTFTAKASGIFYVRISPVPAEPGASIELVTDEKKAQAEILNCSLVKDSGLVFE